MLALQLLRPCSLAQLLLRCRAEVCRFRLPLRPSIQALPTEVHSRARSDASSSRTSPNQARPPLLLPSSKMITYITMDASVSVNIVILFLSRVMIFHSSVGLH